MQSSSFLLAVVLFLGGTMAQNLPGTGVAFFWDGKNLNYLQPPNADPKYMQTASSDRNSPTVLTLSPGDPIITQNTADAYQGSQFAPPVVFCFNALGPAMNNPCSTQA